MSEHKVGAKGCNRTQHDSGHTCWQVHMWMEIIRGGRKVLSVSIMKVDAENAGALTSSFISRATKHYLLHT